MREPSESELTARLPELIWSTPYVGRRFPGSRSVAERPGLADGANCQFFAYEVLRHLGPRLPPWRSSELWADTVLTERVRESRPQDLALFNHGDEAWGAHVGVVVGEGRVLHLCAEVGRPVIWPLREFATRERYRTLLGFKRPRPGAG
ncbi:hydrolase [Streptomyces sp. NBC_01571]|uniref:hydrolase n=1 Tax=unclassified Streptomyces TaxID=2593676 RepID=UPI00225B8036|nr:hydrolase [Streptomyces sp. NBC_01571]MCX4572413.1 hydrolase [Streptomyces sp. NBC_01571]